MEASLVLGVYRRADDRFDGQGDDSLRDLKLHNLRKDALHEVLDSDPDIRVTNWGKTNDAGPHEFVEIAISAAAGAALQYAIVPGVKWLGRKLAEKAVDTALGELAQAVLSKLRRKQEEKELLDINIKLPDGTWISVDPPDRYATMTIHFADGSIESLEYRKPDVS